MKTLKNYLVVLIFSFSLLTLSSSVRAQNVGINSKGNKPSSYAVLDLRTGNLGSALGFLPNEVSLSATNSASPFSAPDTGLIVYNYATAGAAPNNVVPGYYYWTGSAWVMMLAPGAGTSGQVLTSNGGGAPSWTTLSSNSGWSLTGNSGTTVGTNFIGTTDAQPLEFKVDGSIAGYIDYSGVLANAAFGYQALYSNNNNGISNSAFGYQALYANTTGSNNVATGIQALCYNTYGSYNVAIGQQTLFNGTTGDFNVAVGNGAMSSGVNTGYYNTAIGNSALNDNISGTENIAIGDNPLAQNTTGSNNIGIGNNALNRSNGSYNIGTGYQALLGNITGSYNIATGDSAMWAGVNTGIQNIATGSQALYNNSSGSGNIGVGYRSLANNTTGSYNTALGYNAGVASGALTNATAIGYNATVSASNTMVMGDNSVTQFEFNGALMPYYSSAYNAGILGQVLTSEGSDVAPQWISASSGLGAVRYVGTSYLGITSGAGSTGTSEGTSSNLYNINVGDSAGASNVIGTNNIAIGDQALRANDRINSLVAIGTGALANENFTSPGFGIDGDIGIGYMALNTTTLSYGNVAIGYKSQDYLVGTNDLSANTTVGYLTGSNLVGADNTVVGFEALSSGTTFGGNTNGNDCAFGSQALKNDNGGNNNAFGYQALFTNSGGEFNVANGIQALYKNTNGNNNVAMGNQALFANTTGNNNTAYGYDAMYNSSTGSYNIATGDSALADAANTGSMNIATGSQALFNNSTGSYNIASGFQAMQNNYTGSDNIAIGNRALNACTNPSNIIAIGKGALSSVGTYSVEASLAIGYQALGGTGLSENDVAIGYQAEGNANDISNTTAIGYKTLYNNIGNDNSALGYQAGLTSSSGNENTFLGSGADVSTDGFFNATAIGYNTKVSSSNTILLGNNSVTSTEFNGALMPYYSSAFNAGTSGQVLESKGAGVAPQWVTPTSGTVTGSGTSTQIAFWSGSSALSSNSNLYWDNTNDRLGIGTSSPTAVLHTVASGAKTAAYSGNLLTNSATSSTASIKKAGVEIQSTGSWTGTSASNIGLYVSSTTGGTNNYDAIFNGGGNVGIGTTTPSALLEVAGTGQYIGQFQSSYTDGTWITLNNTSTGGTGWNIISTGQNNGEGAGNLLFNTASGGDAMIIQSSNGYVGIGTSTPAVPLDVYQYGQSLSGTNSTAIQPYSIFRVDGSTGAGVIDMGQLNTGSFAGWIQASYSSGTNPLSLNPQGGNVGIGTTSPTTLLYVTGSTASGGYIATVANTTNASNAPSNGINILAGANSYTSGSTNFVSCKTPNGTQIGSINQSSTTSVSFNTTSDERLKENIIPTKYGINDLMKIQIKDYTYKGDNGQNQQTGYLAQQLYTVFPNAVHVGGADAKTDPWMVDYGRITPLLVKSIQDQQQIIDEQNKKLDAYQQQMTAQQKQIDELKQMMEQMQKNKN